MAIKITEDFMCLEIDGGIIATAGRRRPIAGADGDSGRHLDTLLSGGVLCCRGPGQGVQAVAVRYRDALRLTARSACVRSYGSGVRGSAVRPPYPVREQLRREAH